MPTRWFLGSYANVAEQILNVMSARKIGVRHVAKSAIMHQTPKHIYEEIVRERPTCERAALLRDHVCSGRSTMEHAWIYGGRQIPDKWAVIRLCAWAHLGPGLNKEINHWISLRHATDEDLKKYPRKDWEQERRYLNAKYGE